MTGLHRLAALFNVQPGEGRKVILLILLYFFLGVAFVVTLTVAFSLFLSTYGPQTLPYAYLLTAALAASVAFFYLKLVERLPFPTLLTVNLIFLLIGGLVFRIGLATPIVSWVVFALPAWFQVLVSLGNMAFWALTSSLFDVRQGKRLFGLVGAGNWIATVVGGFVIAPLVGWVGTANLLLLAAASVVAALIILRMIIGAYLSGPPPAPAHTATAKAKPAPSLFRSRYVLLIFAFIFLWWLGFYFVDNIFYDRAAAQFADADQLAPFLGNFNAATGFVALFTTTFLTAPIVNRFGLWGGLLTVPTILVLSLGALALIGTAGGAVVVLFGLAALAKLMDVAIGFGLDQPAHTVLYKPMPVTQIGRVATVGEGIVQPLAIGAAGLSLLLFNTLLSLNAIGLSYAFLIIGVAWIAVTISLIRAYPAALTQALAKRQLGDPLVGNSPRSLADLSSLSLLQQTLRNPYPGAAIYAMNALEQIEPAALASALPNLLDHPAPEVRREAFRRIERLELTGASAAVRRRLGTETAPEVKEAAYRALAMVGKDEAFNQVVAALEEADPHTRRGALVGLLQHGGIDGIMAAGQIFNRLAGSSASAERTLAAQVLGETGLTHFYQPLGSLLSDSDPAVRRAALNAAGKIKHPKLWPRVIEASAWPETGRAAGAALAMGGEAALPEIEAAFAKSDQPCDCLIVLARACGRIRGERAARLLQTRINFPDGEVRTQILNALSACGYRATNPAEVHKQIQTEIAQAAWATAALTDIGGDESVSLLASALKSELARTRDRVLFLLSFLYEARTILRAREALNSGLEAQKANALEVIDAQLPADLKGKVMPLLEALPADNRLARWSATFPQTRLTLEDRLQVLIAGREGTWFKEWVRQTARWALAQLDPSAQKGNSVMLSTIEKVIILKTVSVFSQTPDEVLAEVAELLEEMETAEGETIFNKGDLGDSLYVIVDGKVRVHDGDRLLNYLGERDVFGEMALLDPEPRLASVTTVEPSRLFRLAQGPFYELMAERPEVATGIIRVLTGHLRNRVRDIAKLDARVKELERTAQSPA